MNVVRESLCRWWLDELKTLVEDVHSSFKVHLASVFLKFVLGLSWHQTIFPVLVQPLSYLFVDETYSHVLELFFVQSLRVHFRQNFAVVLESWGSFHNVKINIEKYINWLIKRVVDDWLVTVFFDLESLSIFMTVTICQTGSGVQRNKLFDVGLPNSVQKLKIILLETIFSTVNSKWIGFLGFGSRQLLICIIFLSICLVKETF